MLLNLNGKQVIGIIGALISVLMVSTAQLTELLGPTPAKTIVTIAGLINMFMQSVSVVLTSQGATVKDVLAMQGVEKISVNAQANQTLSAIAVDKTVDKIGPTADAAQAVEATAKGA